MFACRQAGLDAAAFMVSLPAQHLGRRPGLAAVIAALSAVGPFAVDTYLPAMPDMAASLRASPLAVQQTLSAYMIPFAFMTLWHGAISDSIGRRRVILWGTGLFALASAAAVFARNVESLLLCRALQGMTAGAGMVVGRAIVRDLYDGAEAQRLMSRVTLMFAIAPAIAPVVGGWLQVGFGWRAIFVFLVAFSGFTWLLVRSVLPETLPVARRQPLRPRFLFQSYRRVLTSPAFLAIALASTLNFSGFFIFVMSAPVFLMRHLGVSETGFLWLFGPATLGMIAGAWGSGRLAGHLAPAALLNRAYAVMALAAVGNVLLHQLMAPTLPWSVAPLVVYVFGMSLAFPTLALLALDLFPEQRGLASSCQMFLQSGGSALSALLAPLVWGSVRSLAGTQALLLVLGFLCLTIYRQTQSRLAPVSAPS
jgi:MFS transporter, DHA1 family, multidrug resistance protein